MPLLLLVVNMNHENKTLKKPENHWVNGSSH
jgi:hypothetical protein